MNDIVFKTTNESKTYNKPKIPAGKYSFDIEDLKLNTEKTKIFFILNIEGQVSEDDEQVSLVWAAPINEEYTPNTNVGKLLLAVGFDLGGEIKAESLRGLKGECLVSDYVKQEGGRVLQYSIVADLIIPEVKTE